MTWYAINPAGVVVASGALYDRVRAEAGPDCQLTTVRPERAASADDVINTMETVSGEWRVYIDPGIVVPGCYRTEAAARLAARDDVRRRMMRTIIHSFGGVA